MKIMLFMLYELTAMVRAVMYLLLLMIIHIYTSLLVMTESLCCII